MSGPKTSRYTLTAEQRRILAEQRKIERRKAVAAENIRRDSKRLLQICGMFNAEKQIAYELLSRTGSDNGLGDLIHELEATIAPIHPFISSTNYDDVTSVEQTAEKVHSCLSSVEKLAEKIVAIAAQNEVSLKTNLQAAIDEGFAASFADIRETDVKNAISVLNDVRQKIGLLRRNAILPQTYMEEIEEVASRLESITDEVFLKNYIALTVNPLIKKSEQFIFEYADCHEEFDALYTEYVALCELYYYVAQEYVCSPSSIPVLRSEIQRIKEAVAEDDEQAYISECLDEVMVEMGYSVLGSREVTKKNGKHFRNELYTYGEGTAVNVTYSSDGKIAMELGGIDATDRLPDEQETSLLCSAMNQFCEDFKEIEKRLLAKGVVVADRISLLPPDAEYAQIINTTEYEMHSKTEKFRAKKQRRSVANLKSMKRE